MSLASLFAGSNFKGTIQRYCANAGWRIAELDDKHAVLRFNMNSGRVQTLYVVRFETTLEFSVPSAAIFDSEDEIPHVLSTALLERNAEKKYGFWCIEKLNGRYAYSYMHNAELQLIDSAYFAAVVRALTNECDDFEALLFRMLGR